MVVREKKKKIFSNEGSRKWNGVYFFVLAV